MQTTHLYDDTLMICSMFEIWSLWCHFDELLNVWQFISMMSLMSCSMSDSSSLWCHWWAARCLTVHLHDVTLISCLMSYSSSRWWHFDELLNVWQFISMTTPWWAAGCLISDLYDVTLISCWMSESFPPSDSAKSFLQIVVNTFYTDQVHLHRSNSY